MWLGRFFGLVIIIGIIIILIPMGAMLLVIVTMLPFVAFAAILLLFYGWPIAGAVISWQSMGLFHRSEKKPHYWGLGLLCLIYGVGILLLIIDDPWLSGDWIFLGNGLGVLLRSGLY
ncbi:hypothetical protein [Herpetosiphon giganteus]|uniref:hypothetical protein n=1 Tax=Herpetosiphon giganteus TaxID=2029754 RepID=UPI001958990F|nr:hypothetical protein [Herpetosiphon giganteus]MBM7843515.1 putative membrane protein [Herpetosiphon giganteus]